MLQSPSSKKVLRQLFNPKNIKGRGDKLKKEGAKMGKKLDGKGE
jgi:hypothetical protein